MHIATNRKVVSSATMALQIDEVGSAALVRKVQDQYHLWRRKRLLATLRAQLDDRALADIGVSKVPGRHDWLIDLARQ